MCVCGYVRVGLRAYVCVCVCAYAHVYVSVRACVCMCVFIREYACVYLCLCIDVFVVHSLNFFNRVPLFVCDYVCVWVADFVSI